MSLETVERQLADLGVRKENRLLPEGTQLAGWRVRGLIGRGGSSEVYRVEGRDGSSAALKLLVRTEEANRIRFAREVSLLSDLPHVSFPKLLTTGEYEGRPYLVEELLESRDLPTTDRGCAELILSLCEGLSTLHRAGCVHRDLKPGNILFRKDGTPVIIDFGLVKRRIVDGLPTEVSVVDGRPVGVGTPGYAAPEQLLGGSISYEADIHALGVLIDRCFNGHLRRGWSAIVRHATSSLPGQRYRTVEELARAVKRRRGGVWPLAGLLFSLAVAVILAIVLRPLASNEMAVQSSVPAVEQRFPRELSLEGRTVVFDKPVVLQAGETCRITGPGCLDADISGPTNALVVLSRCTVINRSPVPYPANGVRYRLDGGVYLNFINQRARLGNPVRPPSVMWPYDAALNEVRFSGPESAKDLKSVRLDP